LATQQKCLLDSIQDCFILAKRTHRPSRSANFLCLHCKAHWKALLLDKISCRNGR